MKLAISSIEHANSNGNWRDFEFEWQLVWLQPNYDFAIASQEAREPRRWASKFYIEAEASASDLTFVDQAKWYGVRCDLSYAYNYEFDLNRNRWSYKRDQGVCADQRDHAGW